MGIRIEDLVAAVALAVADRFLEWGMIALIAAMFYGALGYLAFDCRRKNYHHIEAEGNSGGQNQTAREPALCKCPILLRPILCEIERRKVDKFT